MIETDENEFEFNKNGIKIGGKEYEYLIDGINVIKSSGIDLKIMGKSSNEKKNIYIAITKLGNTIEIEGNNYSDFADAIYGIYPNENNPKVIVKTNEIPLNLLSNSLNSQITFTFSSEEMQYDSFALRDISIYEKSLILNFPNSVKTCLAKELKMFNNAQYLAKTMTLSKNSIIEEQKIVKTTFESIEIMDKASTQISDMKLTGKLNLNFESLLTLHGNCEFSSTSFIGFNYDNKATSDITKPQIQLDNSATISGIPKNISLIKQFSKEVNEELEDPSPLGTPDLYLICGKSFSSCSEWRFLFTKDTSPYIGGKCVEDEEMTCLVGTTEPNEIIKPVDSGKEKLPPGAIAGIVIAVIVVVAVIVVLCVYFLIIKPKGEFSTSSTDDDENSIAI